MNQLSKDTSINARQALYATIPGSYLKIKGMSTHTCLVEKNLYWIYMHMRWLVWTRNIIRVRTPQAIPTIWHPETHTHANLSNFIVSSIKSLFINFRLNINNSCVVTSDTPESGFIVIPDIQDPVYPLRLHWEKFCHQKFFWLCIFAPPTQKFWLCLCPGSKSWLRHWLW